MLDRTGTFLACHPDDITAIITTVAADQYEPVSARASHTELSDVLRTTYERKVSRRDPLPTADVRASTAAIRPTTHTTATPTAHAQASAGNAHMWRAFVVLIERSLLIGPLWCKVAPLTGRIVAIGSKIPRAPLTACTRATNTIARVMCGFACKFLEGMVTPKGECGVREE